MPRKYSKTGVYHVMVRGNAKSDIFIDNQDKWKFLKVILQKRKEDLFQLYAYCIMNNHAHLVLEESAESISNSMKGISTSYAFYFNKKYNRVGHVFQDRFRSEVIKNDSHLLAVIRYVHNNPEKAGIMSKEEYPWSSYRFYISKDGKIPEFIYILKMLSSNLEESVKLFKDFSNQFEKKEFLDINSEKEIIQNNDDVYRFIEQFLKNNSIKKNNLNDRIYIKYRDNLIKELIRKFNLSKRGIAEITGLNRETVRRVSKSVSKEPSPWQTNRRW